MCVLSWFRSVCVDFISLFIMSFPYVFFVSLLMISADSDNHKVLSLFIYFLIDQQACDFSVSSLFVSLLIKLLILIIMAVVAGDYCYAAHLFSPSRAQLNWIIGASGAWRPGVGQPLLQVSLPTDDENERLTSNISAYCPQCSQLLKKKLFQN